MDINALRTFLEVAKTQHFGRAADNLFVSQSTVSTRIRALEESLGSDLFVRERSNIHLTPSGEALVSHAKTILTVWSRARHDLGMPEGIENNLVVGGLSGLWDITLQNWLSKITKQEKDIAISADIFSSDLMIERVMNGSMDIGFIYDAPQGQNIVSVPLKEINLRLVSSRADMELNTALTEGYIRVDWGLNFAVQFAAKFPDTPPAKLQTGLGRIAFEFIKRSNGSAYLAEAVVNNAIKNKELYYVDKAPTFKRTAYAIYHQQNEKYDLIQRILSLL